MIKKLNFLTNTQEKKRLFSNFYSLSFLQAANYLLPLITLPYLVRVLGMEYVGLLGFATALVTYLTIISDYGFNLSATREIALHKDNKEKVEEIFSSVMSIKFLLLLISFILILVLIFSFEKLLQEWLVYLLTFCTVIGQVLFPVWFFQGMQRMRYIALLNMLSKFIFTVAIFIFVQKQSDFYIVPLLASIGAIIAGVFALIVVKKEFKVSFKPRRVEVLKYYIIDGWHIFTSSLGVNLYKTNAIVVLGIFTNDTIVGYFWIAKKVIDTLNQIASTISITIFPYINSKYTLNRDLINFLIKLGIVIFAYSFTIFIVLFFFAEEISLLLSGGIYNQLVQSLKIMAIVPLVIALNVPAVHILLLGKKDKYFAKTVLIGGVVDLVFLFILIPFYSYVGASFAVLLSELFVTTVLYIYALRVIRGKL